MTNEQILAWARSISYAHLDLEDISLGYGKQKWEQRLPELSQEQRAMLIRQIEQWEVMRTEVC